MIIETSGTFYSFFCVKMLCNESFFSSLYFTYIVIMLVDRTYKCIVGPLLKCSNISKTYMNFSLKTKISPVLYNLLLQIESRWRTIPGQSIWHALSWNHCLQFNKNRHARKCIRARNNKFSCKYDSLFTSWSSSFCQTRY